MKIRIINALLIAFCLASCTHNTTPKPIAYDRIDIPHFENVLTEFKDYNFERSSLSYIDSLASKSAKDGEWFNIVYPDFKVRVYCSYTPIKPLELRSFLEDSHQLAYSHAVKANGIQQTKYQDDSRRVYGILYDIEGSVATPIQFFLTDSTSHFFRASFYYDAKVNPDSVAPVTDLVRSDILKMIETFEWKSSK